MSPDFRLPSFLPSAGPKRGHMSIRATERENGKYRNASGQYHGQYHSLGSTTALALSLNRRVGVNASDPTHFTRVV